MSSTLSISADTLFTRHAGNPILSPNPANEWESLVVTNPTVAEDPATGDVIMLYRAAGNDDEHRVVFGLARSRDGKTFERVSDTPVFVNSESGFDGGCVEDPRVVRFGDWYFVTYASRPFAPGKYWATNNNITILRPELPPEAPWLFRNNATSTGLAITKDFRSWIRLGRLTLPTVDNRDVILFPEKVGGKFVLLQRPMQWAGEGFDNAFPGIWISFSDDVLHWPEMQLLAQGVEDWEHKIGGNSPPLRTDLGWLVLYHAVGADKLYRLGALILDIDDPTKILYRSPEPFLTPSEDYEIDGFYPGVIFPCGQVVRDNVLHLYYGGADRFVGLATCPLNDLLEYMKAHPVA